jgi:phenylalanyl-tRNA synthetase beta subunit
MTVENRMVVESEWDWQKTKEVEEVMQEKGYHEMGTNKFVPEADAFEYALERCMNGIEAEQKEFKEMLVDWFYSGNWVKED